jgi:hypothetical protein
MPESTVSEFLFGTKPELYLAILVAALLIRFVCIPLIEWAIDLGERTAARGVYQRRQSEHEDRRKLLDAAARATRGQS